MNPHFIRSLRLLCLAGLFFATAGLSPLFGAGMQAQIPDTEYQALMELYNSTGGANWRNKSGWLDPSASSWHGVKVIGVVTDANGNVTQKGNVFDLLLEFNGLNGSIPASLGNLERLQRLILSANNLSGSIPASLGNLGDLQELGLSSNWLLSGSIPRELGNLRNLRILKLQQNQLSGSIPPELGKLSKLTDLVLGSNQLSGSIPPELGDLSDLRTLSLGGTNFVGSHSNQLSGPIPASLEKLTKLTNLTLSYNQLSGSIPAWLGSLTQMQFLQLESNDLSGSIPDLSTLQGLIYLHLSANQLSGSIPAWVTSLLALEDLWLDHNQLTGSIPPDLGNLGSLTRLYLHSNQLTGSIPSSLGNLSNLGYLLLSNNQLSGGIPASLGRLSQLWNLELNDNQLSGGIPPSLGDLHELYYLYLNNNHLSCGIPSELLNLFEEHPSFGRLNIASNCLLIDNDGTAILDGLRSIGVTVTSTPQQQNCPRPEIVVLGKSRSISDGDNTPSFADYTNFGALPLGAVTTTGTFTVHNTGAADLTLGEIVIGGTHAADYSVTQAPSSLVAPGASTTFQVTLTPSAPGMRSASLSFATNDCDENPFDFSIQGGEGSGLTMHRAEPAAIENATGTVVDQPLLLKADGAALLASTQKEVLGLVADGVTPLLFHLRQTNLLTTPKYRFTATVTGGGKIFGGQNLGLTALQNGAWTSSASGPLHATLTSMSGTDPDKHAFVCLNAIPNESVSLSAGSREVACDLVAQEVDDSGNAIGTPSTVSFLIRKPPIVLVHGFNSDSDSWSSPFLSKLVASRAYDFVLPIDYGTDASAYGYDGYLSINTNGRLDYLARVLDGVLKQDVESPGAGLFADWAITRYDVVGHSQGGVLLRMLCQNVGSNIPLFSSTPFRDSSNNYRGRFRRVITIGSPHNGSRLSYYVQGLAKTDHCPLPAVMKGLGLLQPKFDPFGEQIRQINNTDSKVDSDAKFNLITSTIEGGKFPQPGSPVPLIYFLPRLTSILPGSAQTIGKTVIPLGSDGVVDLDSESATSFQGTIVNKVSPMGFDICHSPLPRYVGGFLFFGVGDGESDTNEPLVAAKALDLLDGPASGFLPFVLPKIQSDQAKIDAVTPTTLLLDVITYFLPGAPAPPPGSGAASYSFKLQPYSTQPLQGTVSWYAEAFGFDGPMPDGITLKVDAADSTKVTVTVESWVEGDVVLYANYMSTKGKWIVGKPVVVVSNAMAASLTGLELSPAAPSLLVGQTQAIDILGIYEDQVISQLYVPGGGVGQIISSNPLVASVNASNVVTARAVGTATLSVTFKGLSAQTTVTVAPATTSEIAIWSSGVAIPSGSVTPTVPGQTDFGSVAVSGSPLNRTFLISNTGSAALNLTGTPKVAITGANAADFAVTTQPASPLKATTGTSTFSIAFTPSAPGTRAATISIASNDSDESPYTFSIQGTGTQPSNADLSGLVVNTASLSPAFASGTTSYAASVPNGMSSITLTPTKAAANATIQVRINGGSFVAVNSGSASTNLSLNVGANNVDVKVTAQDGTTRIYTIYVTRASNAATWGTVVAWGNNDYGQTTVPVGLSGVISIAAGRFQTVALKNDGMVVAWGGYGGFQSIVPAGLTGVIAIAAGYGHIVALKNDGTVVAWGSNSSGQATVPEGLSGVTAVAAGYDHTVALKSDGTVVAWGYNGNGQTTVPAGLSDVSAIAAGENHTLALKNDGEVVAWGNNFYGQTTGGPPTTTAPYSATANPVVGISGVATITAGAHHSMVLKNNGTVQGFGSNFYGQGVSPGGVSGVVAICAGGLHTVALKNDGTVVAWGLNSHSQTTVPAGLSGVIDIAAGESHTVALVGPSAKLSSLALSSGALSPEFTGGTVSYKAGVSEATTSITVTPTLADPFATVTVNGSPVSARIASGPVPLKMGTNVIRIVVTAQDGATKKNYTVNVVRSLHAAVSGTVVAWGLNDEGQTTVPEGLSGVSSIAAGYAHTVVLKNDGIVVAWGLNNYGQTTVPAGLSGVSAITAGVLHTVALKNDGMVVAWGDNGHGQTTVPAGLSGVSAIAAGGRHTVALKNDGMVVAWGYNRFGQTTVPAGLSGVSAIAAGYVHTVALKNDGTVVAWGDNGNGQTTAPAGLSDVIAIAAGFAHTVALKNDGTVLAWGDNSDGQTTVPAALNGVSAIAAGGYHTVALKNDGTVVAWGGNGSGEATVPPSLRGAFAIAAGSGQTVTLLGMAPDIAVEQPVGTGLVDGSTSVNFDTVNTGSSRTLTFTLKNTGTTSLTSPSDLVITKDGAEAADYVVTNPLVTTLVPGAKTTFTVKFAPTAAGPRNALIHIVSDDPDESPFDIALGGTGFAKSAITVQPVGSCLVGVDEPAFLSVAATGSGKVTCNWFKNGIPIAGASTTSFYIPTAGFTDAGSYSATATNAAGSTTSSSTRLGVVSVAPSSVAVNEGATLKLTVSRSIPTGATVSYQWKRNGSDLMNGGVSPAQVISGAKSATLSITKAAAANAGDYICVVGMGEVTKESGTFGVTVRLKPVVNPAGPLTWYVSGAIADQFTATNSPVSFTFSGLPSGVTGSTRTGQLSGRPLAATTSPKTFTVAATNAVGTGAVRTITYSVADLPPAAIGTFNGLVNRGTTLSGPTVSGGQLQGHGGSLENLVITNTGTFTGTLKLEEKSYPIPAGSRLDAHGTGHPTATVHLIRGTTTDAIADLTLTFQINKSTGELTGMVTDGKLGSTPIPVRGWRNPWKTTGTIASPANPASTLAARYTAMMDFADSLLDTNTAYPQGHGYGTLIITAAGVATWSGVLADGTVVTRSTTMGPNGEVPLHWILYTPTVAATAGSAHGWVKVQAGAAPTEPDDNLLDTMLDLTQGAPKDQPVFDWMKKPQLSTSAARSYKDGFMLHKLTVTGGGYVKPGTNVRVLGLTNANDKGKLTFSSANLETSVTYLNAAPGSGPTASMNGKLFTITSANMATFSPLPNPATLAVTIDAATGSFNGSFTLKNDPDPTDHLPPITLLQRTGVKFNGILVQRLNKGFGNFQLPQLPNDGPPKTKLSTSPQLSGQVLLEVGP